jgi:spore coat polysaccharide biosynthesis predicted glycosyltransferase SpsG/GTP:adenosylcobinamide-phosphate guanylyltransferase
VSNVALIPARGGSVGVRRKNLRTVGGLPLVVRTVRAALSAESVDRVVVSTDDPEVASLARRAGSEVMGRPDALAGPFSTVSDVVAWHVDELGLDPDDDSVCVLQPTSPFTNAWLIDSVYEACAVSTSAATVRPIRHALWTKAGPIHKQAANRQDVRPWAWGETGAVTWVRSWGRSVGPVPGTMLVSAEHNLIDPVADLGCSPEEAARFNLDVDLPEDFALARDLATRGRIVFAVTAGHDTGSGHLHRCLTLADELGAHDVSFAPRGEQAAWALDMIRHRGYGLSGGHSTAADVIVFDCLEHVTGAEVLAAKAQGSNVVVLECLDRAVVAHADLAVNSLYDGPAGALCGPRWEPLRPEFALPAEPARLVDDARRRVLISFGGTDPSRLTERFAQLVSQVPGVDPVVLWPPGRDVEPESVEVTQMGDAEPRHLLACRDYPVNAEVWEGAVSDALASCHFAVTSAGRTVLEAAAMSRPAVVVRAHEREELHALVPGVLDLGHHATVTDDAFRGAVDWLARNPAEVTARGARARGTVDPTGATVALARLIDSLARHEG